ncbi:MAG: hypothetical protein JSW26_02185 [Desulfobacterales bacterium]|nr:MAG: hypothetical protein JSW26_02185 [Desulfobacterales bacterium]
MEPQTNISIVKGIMAEFSDATGLATAENPPRRYLWTDAFAVCNFLELYDRTGDESWRNLAFHLVDQVHYILGRHREDDPRAGWISGLSEEEGKRHPTAGGLRIGKQQNERKPDDPYDNQLEWDRDGQYYHYLTKWMHALNRVSRSTGDASFNLWAIELAKAAHAGFVRALDFGSKRVYWKMSIDLSYPLVSSMGHHDPLDGLITYTQIQATAVALFNASRPELDSEIADMASLCQGKNWATDDPLGLGGLLCHAYTIVQLMDQGRFNEDVLLKDLLASSLAGLDAFMLSPFLEFPAGRRLAFRELGLSIGLHAVERIEGLIGEEPNMFDNKHSIYSQIRHLRRFACLGEAIEKFWLDPQNRTAASWTEHQDINSVMLATSLAPDGYLKL